MKCPHCGHDLLKENRKELYEFFSNELAEKYIAKALKEAKNTIAKIFTYLAIEIIILFIVILYFARQ
ncbi:hypothetical protein [Carboxydothermus ferrireducens]|uniref:Membrane protein YvbJ n=2 Tax=Carboxydothermus TaxID=129957 RepID=A0ABX2R7M9_9THEO|nr:hypothetical protein [Carboxydothermus ferrireducens]NYE57181.1 putative membrane protein YvbJ [Carboxydothermus ferrireducens DSM 11255]